HTPHAERSLPRVVGKQVIHCTDRAGFVVNALLRALLAARDPDGRVRVRVGRRRRRYGMVSREPEFSLGAFTYPWRPADRWGSCSRIGGSPVRSTSSRNRWEM